MQKNLSSYSDYLLIAILGMLVFLPFLGNAHLFDWDEANFAEAAREMLVTKNWMRVHIDFHPFWEKPPIFIWMQALSMMIFGINEFAARLPNAVIGIISLICIFYYGKKIANRNFAWIWVGLYAGSWLPHFYFKSGIIDPTFNLFIFLAFAQLWMALSKKSTVNAILSGVFLGLAVLTKGPAAILIAMLAFVAYLIWKRPSLKNIWKEILILTIACAVTSFSWFGWDILQNGWWFTNEFITYQIRLFQTQDAGHGGPFFYHFVVLLIGCFPASLFWFNYQRRQKEFYATRFDESFTVWMYLLFWVTLILFSIVKTKIVHYSSLCYFPLTYFGARELYLIWNGERSLKKTTQVLLIIFTIILSVLFIGLPIMGMNLSAIMPLVKDRFAQANMQANVQWQWWELIIGLLFLVLTIWAIREIKQGKRVGFYRLIFAQIIIIEMAILHFTPKVEAISQRAAIDFYRKAKEENAIIYPIGFKSYAYLFYSEKKTQIIPEGVYKVEYLINHPTQETVYFITKNIKEEEVLQQYPMLQKIAEKNGYVLLKKP